MRLTTTFTLLRQHRACADRYRHLAKALGGVRRYGRSRAIPISRILALNGFNDALWALRAVPPGQVAARDRLARLLACDYAEHVLPMWTAVYPDDPRLMDTIAVARRYAIGEATEGELAAAYAVAYAASATAHAAYAAHSAALAVANAAAHAAGSAAAANTAESAARSAAGSARSAAQSAAESAWSAAESAWSARSAAESAWSARSAAQSAAESAWSAERAWQTARLRSALAGGPR